MFVSALRFANNTRQTSRLEVNFHGNGKLCRCFSVGTLSLPRTSLVLFFVLFFYTASLNQSGGGVSFLLPRTSLVLFFGCFFTLLPQTSLVVVFFYTAPPNQSGGVFFVFFTLLPQTNLVVVFFWMYFYTAPPPGWFGGAV